MPDIFLENRLKSLDERVPKVREWIVNGMKYLVAEDFENKKIVWMLIYGASRNEKYPNAWEIYAIYVLDEYQKLGIGKKLFFEWIQELLNLGYNDMIVNVLEWNKTINFYKKYWWNVVWDRNDSLGKLTIHEFVMLFENLKEIIK
jgi:GNAT superfamily N-acetyltransferase